MGALKYKRKKKSALQHRKLNSGKAKLSHGKPLFSITGVKGALTSPKSGETVRLYAYYPARGTIAVLRGSSPRGISKNPANLARSTALNISVLHHATQTPFEAMAESCQIKRVTKSVNEAKAEAKNKIERLKELYSDRESRRRVINTSLLREAIQRATFDHGLSLRSATEVRILCN